MSQIDKGGVSLVLAVENVAASDRVLHAGLLPKLQIQRVGGILMKWIEIYLNTGNWQQFLVEGAPPCFSLDLEFTRADSGPSSVLVVCY